MRVGNIMRTLLRSADDGITGVVGGRAAKAAETARGTATSAINNVGEAIKKTPDKNIPAAVKKVLPENLDDYQVFMEC